MKSKNTKPRFISFRPGSIIYAVLLPVSLVFTQALRSPASAILFIFLLILPIISLIYLIVARAGIKIYTECDKTRAEKDQPVSYEIKIINETPLPFPFVETVVSLPSENAVICRDELMRITLLPMGAHIVNSVVSFPLRGSYDIGVKYLYISDLFGLFRTEMKLELHRTVIVYPRSITMAADSNRNDTDLPTPVTKRSASPEQAEPADIRNYVPGDSMKNIHWKLSSKSEELLVKNFSSNTDKHTYILCDLSFAGVERHIPAEQQIKSGKRQRLKKLRRRKEKAVKNAGGNNSVSAEAASVEGDIDTALANTREKLEALGVTPEHIAAIGNLDIASEMPIEESATRKGEKNAQKLVSRRLASLAVSIGDGDDSGANEMKTPFCTDKLPFAGELCADAVVELALSAMRYEVQRGADCTVLYPDARSDSGFGILSSANDISEDPSLIRFFTAPVCRDREAFSRLALMVEQSSGLTIRMVSANTDIHSAAVFAAIPAAFGGAGTGCTAEVMLASPDGLWASEADRSVASQAMSEELSRSSIATRQFTAECGNDGNPRFTSGN